MIIGFTNKTSKILPQIFCRNFRHCVVLFPTRIRTSHYLAQVGVDGIRLIRIDSLGIKKLQSAGWIFINPGKQPVKSKYYLPTINLLTCVGFAKRALGIRNPFIWTPDQLYRYLKKVQS